MHPPRRDDPRHGEDACARHLVRRRVEGRSPTLRRTRFDRAARRNRFVTIASGTSSITFGESLHVRSDAVVCSAMLDAGATLKYKMVRGQRAYLIAPDGAIEVGGVRAEAGDRVLCEGSGEVMLHCLDATEVVVIETCV